MSFRNLCALMGITENDLYNNEDKIEEADDNDEFGINTEENMAENDDGDNTVDDKGNVEMVEEKGEKIATMKRRKTEAKVTKKIKMD